MYEVVSSIDAVYTIVIYLFFAYYIGKYTDHIFNKLFGDIFNKKTEIQLVLECSIQASLTAIIAFLFRKIISKIPFPFNGYKGYSRIKLNELAPDATIIWSAFILCFEPSFVNKIKLLKAKMTDFNLNI
jgi:hypothetical protein